MLELLAGCASVTEIPGPEGQATYLIECPGPAAAVRACLRKAHTLCPSGFAILDVQPPLDLSTAEPSQPGGFVRRQVTVGPVLLARPAGVARASRPSRGGDEAAGGRPSRTEGGADRFVYDQTYDSPPAAADVILDFSRKQGAPASRFVGQAQFTGAGRIRFFKAGGDTVVEVNTDDTAPGAEMRIVLDPLVSLHAADFVL